jgi:cytoskeletal protein RodZ
MKEEQQKQFNHLNQKETKMAAVNSKDRKSNNRLLLSSIFMVCLWFGAFRWFQHHRNNDTASSEPSVGFIEDHSDHNSVMIVVEEEEPPVGFAEDHSDHNSAEEPSSSVVGYIEDHSDHSNEEEKAAAPKVAIIEEEKAAPIQTVVESVKLIPQPKRVFDVAERLGGKIMPTQADNGRIVILRTFCPFDADTVCLCSLLPPSRRILSI